mgnify:CR=1 FL=1
MDFGSKIHDDFKYLLNLLLDKELHLVSFDGGNLSIELFSQKSNFNLEKLKEMFVFIRNFGADVGMADFTNEFNDGNDKNLLGKFKELRGRIEEKFGSVEILEEIENSIIPDAKKALCSSPEPEEQPWNIITEREIVDINNGIKSGFLPTYENKPSLWQRAKTFFTKTIPNFFRKVFGSTDSITKLNKSNSREIFTDAAKTQGKGQTNGIMANIRANSQNQTQQIHHL